LTGCFLEASRVCFRKRARSAKGHPPLGFSGVVLSAHELAAACALCVH